MTKPIERDPIYRGRRFQTETIELCVRWYITYRLSYRDLTAMLAERGIVVSHTAIMRWVLHYVPEYERRWARFAKRPGSSWRMDETAVSVRGWLHYLYRAVDKNRQNRRFRVASGSRHGSRSGLFPKSCGVQRLAATAQDQPRRECREPLRAPTTRSRRSWMEIGRRSL